MDRLRIALHQINFVVGDIAGNVARIRDAYRQSVADGAGLVLFSELAIQGYGPDDLLLRPGFQQTSIEAAKALAKETADTGVPMLVGGLWKEGDDLINAALWMEHGEVVHAIPKMSLPNFGVFYEKRHFVAAKEPRVIDWNGMRVGIIVCRDVWDDWVIDPLAAQSPDLVLVLNASPYDAMKRTDRDRVTAYAVKQCDVPLIYLNQVGGQDELVFDGLSFIRHPDLEIPVWMKGWEEDHILTDWRLESHGWRCVSARPLEEEWSWEETVYSALVTGLRDYVQKNGFPGVLLGLSGGIDSALVAAIAVDALGAEKVAAYALPSRYTSQASLDDAAACATRLGIGMETIAIAEPVKAMEGVLAPHFAGKPVDVTEENLQSRIRGTLLMALSNKFGRMLLSTGNKSEMAVGYATLYGDMNGGFNPIKDVYKTEVYKLAAWRNTHVPRIGRGPKGEVIPAAIIGKAPSAELRPDQTDQDSLPPYPVLDAILYRLIEQKDCVEAIARDLPEGADVETVKKVTTLLYVSEYKRFQAPPGPKVSICAFGRERRYPLTNKYRSH